MMTHALADPRAMHFIRARTEDFEFFRTLHRQAMRPGIDALFGWNDEVQAARLRKHYDPRTLRFVLLEDGRFVRVGCFDLRDAPDGSLFLSQMYLLPEWQNQGLGTRLLEYVLMRSVAQVKDVTLKVLKNSPALRLYQRLAFVIVGEDEYQYHMRRTWDAVPF